MRKINIAPLVPKLINHITLVLDASSSINSYGLANALIETANKQIAHFKTEEARSGQKTLVSIYTFADTVKCLCFDTDVNYIPNIRDNYRANGNTALIDGAIESISKTTQIFQKEGEDHAFLFIILTDGEENHSKNSVENLKFQLRNLPENYTVSILVPNQHGVRQAQLCGFPDGNITIWETTVKGLQEVERTVSTATTSYYMGRASGQRATKSFYSMPVENLNTRTLQTQLDVLTPNQYQLYPVFKKTPIKEFVEKRTGKSYRIGSVFFALTKSEKIQNYKNILVQEKLTGKVYAGSNARKILELPDYEVTVNPASHSKYDLFVQSTSSNRNLVAGTQIIILN